MGKHLKILTAEFLVEYSNKLKIDWFDVINQFRTKNFYSKDDFEYYIQVSATYSSNIEGNSIDIDTYLKNNTNFCQLLLLNDNYINCIKYADLTSRYSVIQRSQI